jgi:hypothetical protein
VKRRHGCLTAALVVVIIANSAAALRYTVQGETIRQAIPGMPGWALPVLIVFSLFNLACAVALLRWKRWGFWGFCVSSAVAFAVNLSLGVGIGGSLLGLLGVPLLYWVLQIGEEEKGWPQLE